MRKVGVKNPMSSGRAKTHMELFNEGRKKAIKQGKARKKYYKKKNMK